MRWTTIVDADAIILSLNRQQRSRVVAVFFFFSFLRKFEAYRTDVLFQSIQSYCMPETCSKTTTKKKLYPRPPMDADFRLRQICHADYLYSSNESALGTGEFTFHPLWSFTVSLDGSFHIY